MSENLSLIVRFEHTPTATVIDRGDKRCRLPTSPPRSASWSPRASCRRIRRRSHGQSLGQRLGTSVRKSLWAARSTSRAPSAASRDHTLSARSSDTSRPGRRPFRWRRRDGQEIRAIRRASELTPPVLYRRNGCFVPSLNSGASKGFIGWSASRGRLSRAARRSRPNPIPRPAEMSARRAQSYRPPIRKAVLAAALLGSEFRSGSDGQLPN